MPLAKNGKNWIQISFVNYFAIPNRRLLSRKTEFEFVRPYDLIPKYRAFCEARPAEGGASEQALSPENLKCLDWSQLLNEARTYFERNSDWLPRFARQKLDARAGKKEGGWGGEKEFLPALAFRFRFFRRRRISYFALRNAPPREKMLCLPRPPVRAQQIIAPWFCLTKRQIFHILILTGGKK